MKILDMDKFEAIASTPNDPSRVSKICWNTFHGSEDDDNKSNASCLLSATTDSLRSWEIEPKVRCTTGADYKWGGAVADMVVNQSNQLVVGSFNSDSLNIHAVELGKLPRRGVAGRSVGLKGQDDAHHYDHYRARSPHIASGRVARTPPPSSRLSLGGIIGKGMKKCTSSERESAAREKRGAPAAIEFRNKTPSPAYIVETPPSSCSESKGTACEAHAKRLMDAKRSGRESPLPPTFLYEEGTDQAAQKSNYRDDAKEGDIIIMPNEYDMEKRYKMKKVNSGKVVEDGEEDGGGFSPNAENIVEAIVAANNSEHKQDGDDSVLSCMDSSCSNANDDSARQNLGHLYDFASAMGVAAPCSSSPAKGYVATKHRAAFYRLCCCSFHFFVFCCSSSG